MILLLRITVIFLALYFIYILYEWLTETYSKHVPCPHCEGDGTWETTEEVETCILCQGSGVIEREE